MCQYCRDLSPADCPACQDKGKEYDELLQAVENEMFRDIGEPIDEPLSAS